MELLELLGALIRRERQPDLKRPPLGPLSAGAVSFGPIMPELKEAAS